MQRADFSLIGGHFIVITGIEGNTLSIYDPYLYAGKFTTASRKAANVTVKGNTVYVSVDNFKKYANCQSFFSYKYDASKVTSNNTTVTTNKNTNISTVKSTNYKARVTARIGLNIRSGASTNYRIVGGYAYGTTVTITKESNGWGKTSKGWICLDYVSKISTTTTTSTSTNKTMTVIAKIGLNVRSGPGTNYKIVTAYPYNTKVTVLSTSGNWAKTSKGYMCLDYLK